MNYPKTPGVRPIQHLVVWVGIIIVATFSGCSDDSDLAAPEHEDPLGKIVDGGPQPVVDLQVANDDTLWATVHFSWDKPLPNPLGFKVEEYHVVVNTSGGNITRTNWDRMVVLDVIDATGDDSYSVTFDNTDGSIHAGILESFAVRPLYKGDVWGPIGKVISLAPAISHFQWGYVKDELGNPLADVTVRLVSPTGINDPRGFVSEQVTDANGRFNPIGPIHESATMVLVTDSPDTVSTPGAEDAYFDFRSEPLGFNQFTSGYDFVLITRYDVDSNMTLIGNETLVRWLQRMTLALNSAFGYTLQVFPPDAYPLKVHIPDGETENGLDMDEAMRSALVYLTTQIGGSLFVETAFSSEAHITVEFPASIPGKLGVIKLVSPGGSGFGYVVPEIISVSISGAITTENTLARVCRHEVIHALGHYQHVNGVGYLMGLGTGESSISDDEVRVIQALLGLPNEVLMSNYESSFPDYPTY